MYPIAHYSLKMLQYELFPGQMSLGDPVYISPSCILHCVLPKWKTLMCTAVKVK